MTADTARYKLGLFLGRHETPHSGLWRYSVSLSKAIASLLERDNKFYSRILAFSSENLPSSPENLDVEIISDSFGLRRFGILTDLFYKTKSCDLIHGTANFLPLLKSSKKRVLTVHDLLQIFPEVDRSSFYIKLRSFFYKTIYKHIFKNVDLIICSNSQIKKDLKGKLSVKTRIEVLPLPIGEQYIDSKKLVNSIKNKYLLAFASKDPRKNITLVLEAFKKVKEKSEVCLVLVSNSFDVSNKLNSLIEQFEISSSSEIFTNVSDEKLLELYQGASGLVFPSKSEGFGYPVYEALSQKCPVLLGNKFQILEVIPSADPGLVTCDVTSCVSLVKGIFNLLEVEEDLEKVSKDIGQKLNPKNIAKSFIKLYEEILSL